MRWQWLAAGLVLALFANEAMAWCGRPRRPYWSAPSPTLQQNCRHLTGIRHASYTLDRHYTSPHVLGYGGMGCCPGNQPETCLAVLGGASGPRCWAPAYCDALRTDGHAYGAGSCPEFGPYFLDSALVGEAQIGSYGLSLAGWEQLGQIPNDSLASGGMLEGAPTSANNRTPTPRGTSLPPIFGP